MMLSMLIAPRSHMFLKGASFAISRHPEPSWSPVTYLDAILTVTLACQEDDSTATAFDSGSQ